MKRTLVLGLGLLLGLFGCASGGNTARYAPCNEGDVCASSTVCESPQATGGTFCTYSCDETTTCPNDSIGVPGVCVVGLPNNFCFQDCTSEPCPSGELCTPQQAIGVEETRMVCVPGAGNPLDGTSWQSTTIAPQAQSDGVTTSSYAVTFGPATYAGDGSTSGTFSATLTQTYSTSAMYELAGCQATTTFSGGTFTAQATGPSRGGLTVTGATDTTRRTGCAYPSDDVIDEIGDYATVNSGLPTGYVVTDSTLTIGGGSGGTPYPDQVNWTFTKM